MQERNSHAVYRVHTVIQKSGISASRFRPIFNKSFATKTVLSATEVYTTQGLGLLVIRAGSW
jgi:hypothetical protein